MKLTKAITDIIIFFTSNPVEICWGIVEPYAIIFMYKYWLLNLKLREKNFPRIPN